MVFSRGGTKDGRDDGGEGGVGSCAIVDDVRRAGCLAVCFVMCGRGGDDRVEAGKFGELDGWRVVGQVSM